MLVLISARAIGYIRGVSGAVEHKTSTKTTPEHQNKPKNSQSTPPREENDKKKINFIPQTQTLKKRGSFWKVFINFFQ